MLGTALAYMAAAFFIARISFAAAIAAGGACLSGGGVAGACWATAGTPATASPNARLAADNILARRFIQFSQDLRRYRRSTTRIPSGPARISMRSEEHTSELQSQSNLVCRLLLEKKKKPPRTTLRGCIPRRAPCRRRS